jgi:serine/threonine-protein kinase
MANDTTLTDKLLKKIAVLMEENNSLLKQMMDENHSKAMRNNELLQTILDQGGVNSGGNSTSQEQTQQKKSVIKISEEQNTPIKKGNGVLAWVDREVNLMWEVKQPENMNYIFVFNDAQKHVSHLNNIKYAGFDDWRLPTRDELKTLATKSKLNYLYIKKPLSKNSNYTYWSSTKHDIAIMWIMNFKTGDVTKNDKENYDYVRAVRNFSDS